MKKNILFHKLLIFIVVISSISCFVTNKTSQHMTTIVITNLECSDCNNEIDEMISNINGIEYYEIWMSNDNSVALLNFRFNSEKINLEEINGQIKSNGFNVELINSKE